MALIQRASPERRTDQFRQQVFDARDVTAIDHLLSEDCEVHGVAPGVNDREGYGRVMGYFFEAFPDLHAQHDEVFVDGNTVVTRWTVNGTHEAPLRFVGPDNHEYELSPTGRAVSISGFDMYRFEGKRITELWQSYDGLALLGQLGLLSLGGLRRLPELIRSRSVPSV